MKNNKNNKHIFISVYLQKKGFVPAGVITFNTELGYSGFSYFTSYMEQDFPPLNPSTLNWRDGNQRHFIVSDGNKQMLDRTFWEMLPNQNDWGNQVLISRYPEYAQMNNAEKLYFLGNRVVGGLSAYVKEKAQEESIIGVDWLEKIRDESVDFYMQNIQKISHIKAINPLSSYGGARPKCMFEDDDGGHWIAKFNLPNDPYDMAVVEKTAMDIATDMGLDCAESKILTLASGENVFLSKRFDRKGEKRFHSLSLFALAPGNELQKRNTFSPGNPANFIQKLISRYSDFADQDTLNIVVKMLLDLSVNNTDNHLRNLRVILDENNKWKLSPIYDVIFNPQNQNHTYNPAGLPLQELYLNNPELAQAMSKELGLSESVISKQISKAKGVVNNWEQYAIKNNASEHDKNQIHKAVSLGLNRKEFVPEVKKDNKIIMTPKLKKF